MPPPMSAAMSFDAVAAQPTQTPHYASERTEVLKRMAVLTLLAVALVALSWSWFDMLGSLDVAASTELWAGLRFKLVGGAAGIVGLACAMAYVWVRLVRPILRMDWA